MTALVGVSEGIVVGAGTTGRCGPSTDLVGGGRFPIPAPPVSPGPPVPPPPPPPGGGGTGGPGTGLSGGGGDGVGGQGGTPTVGGFVITTTPARQMAEIQFDVTPAAGVTYANVFDPSVIQVDATIAGPPTTATTAEFTGGDPTGAVDSLAAVQTFLNANNGGVVGFPATAGTKYYLSGSLVLTGWSGTIFWRSSSLQPHYTSTTAFDTMQLVNCANVAMFDFTADGTTVTTPATTAAITNTANTRFLECALTIYGGTNVSLVRPTTHNFWGDGIALRRSAGGTTPTNIIIEQHTADQLGRNAISVISSGGSCWYWSAVTTNTGYDGFEIIPATASDIVASWYVYANSFASYDLINNAGGWGHGVAVASDGLSAITVTLLDVRDTLITKPSTAPTGFTFSNIATLVAHGNHASASVAANLTTVASTTWGTNVNISPSPAQPFTQPGALTPPSLPGGVTVVHPCFWAQKYTPTTPTSGHGENYAISGTPHWYLRFKFPTPGVWSFQITAGATTSAVQSITITAATTTLSQWRIKNKWYFAFDAGGWLPMIGEDVAVEDRDYTLDGTVGYNKWFSYVGTNGGKAVRYMLDEYHRDGPEYLPGAAMYQGFDNYGLGLGQYAQQNCTRIDYALALAETYNVSLLVVFNNHSYFSTSSDARWTDSPYNSANGGPVNSADPGGFLSDPTSLRYQKMKVRYLVARWMPYPAFGALEWMNEGGSVGNGFFAGQNTVTTTASWVQNLKTYVRSIDVWQHLLTWSEEWEPQSYPGTVGQHTDPIFNNCDFACLHDYSDSPWIQNNRRGTATQIIADAQRRLGIPMLHTESGLYRSPSAPEPNFDPSTSGLTGPQIDHLLTGTHVRDCIMNALANGFTGAWEWWHGSYLSEDSAKHRTSGNLPYTGAPVSTYSFPLEPGVYPYAAAIVAAEDPTAWPTSGGTITCAISGSNLNIHGWGYNQRALIYVADALDNYESGFEPGNLVGRTYSGRTLTVNGLVNGSYNLEVWNTKSPGGLASKTACTSTSGVLTVAVPTIDRDAFYKIVAAITTSAPIVITASNTTINGLSFAAANQDGAGFAISTSGSTAASPFTNITITNCTFSGFNTAIFLQFCNTVKIQNCTINDVFYAGILVESCIGGTIDSCLIQRVGPQDPGGVAINPTGNAYGIAITRIAVASLVTNPRSANWTVSNTTVTDVPMWHGFDTHAGDTIVFTNCTVYRCMRPVFITTDAIPYSPLNCTLTNSVLLQAESYPTGGAPNTNLQAVTIVSLQTGSFTNNQWSLSYGTPFLEDFGGLSTGITNTGNTSLP